MGAPAKHKRLSLLLIILFIGTTAPQEKRPVPEIPQAVRDELAGYLETHWMAPEDYVLSKFKDHGIVFIGEHHFIKHDAEFIQGLIPFLYGIGVTDLGIEFGCYEFQDQADALLTAKIYDADLARHLMFQWGTYWPYTGYLELFKKAWELNASLPPEAPKFRIIGLDYHARWDLVEENMPKERWSQILHKGPRDEHMARVIVKEFVKKRKKALIYAGAHHACTRFHVPEYDFKKKKVASVNKRAMGNVVHRKIRDKAFNICLHYPWQTIEGEGAYDYPIGGAVDQIMKDFGGKRVGFDVQGSPFGSLTDARAVYAAAGRDFTFGDFCDGYIYLAPFSEYEGCSVDPLFITEENLAEAIAFLPRASVKAKIKNRLQFLEKMRWDADFRRLYPDLE
jgi:hypothetical protein